MIHLLLTLESNFKEYLFFLLKSQKKEPWKWLLITSLHFTTIIQTFRSGDSTARIWTIAEGRSKTGSQNGPLNVLVLKHVRGRTNEKSKDVTTLDWNVSSIVYSYFTPC